MRSQSLCTGTSADTCLTVWMHLSCLVWYISYFIFQYILPIYNIWNIQSSCSNVVLLDFVHLRRHYHFDCVRSVIWTCQSPGMSCRTYHPEDVNLVQCAFFFGNDIFSIKDVLKSSLKPYCTTFGYLRPQNSKQCLIGACWSPMIPFFLC